MAETTSFIGVLFATPATETEIADTSIQKVSISDGITTVQCIAFPHKYMQLESWVTTPNQREEIKAYRDDNTRDLTRITAVGRKTSIQFKVRPRLHLSEKQDIQNFFTAHETDTAQRKLQIFFWNDESNKYQSGYFYRSNTQFTIEKILADDIIYAEFTIDLVEY
jgi:hypothetical protein